MSDPKQLLAKNDMKKFDLAFEKIVMLAKSDFRRIDKEVNDKFLSCLDYNLIGGKRNRGLFLVRCFQELNPKCSEEQLEKARLLGWCTELFQSYFLIHDDIMDNSITRRGQPCWYRLDNVGLIAINDANYFQNLNFKVLKYFFGTSDCYMELVDLFLDVGAFVKLRLSFFPNLIFNLLLPSKPDVQIHGHRPVLRSDLQSTGQ